MTFREAPVVSVGTWLAVGIATVALSRDTGSALRLGRRTKAWRPILLGALLIGGLWAAAAVVFAFAELGTNTAVPLRVPSDTDGPVTIGSLSRIGVQAAATAGFVLWGVMRLFEPRHRQAPPSVQESGAT
jgi:hypothetical protein